MCRRSGGAAGTPAAGISHRRRASIITVEPARHAASASVNGSAATTSARYARSLSKPRYRTLRHPPHAPRHGIEPRRQAARQPGRIVAQRKIFAPHHFETRHFQQLLHVAVAKVEQVARHVDAVPRAAQHAELPRRRVRHLDHQASIGRQQAVRGRQVSARIVQMLQHVEHGDAGEASGAQRRTFQIARHRRHLLMLPGDRRRLARKVQPHHAKAALAHHAQKQSAAAAHVEQRPARARTAQRPLHEAHVIAQHQAPVRLFQPRPPALRSGANQ